MLAPSLLRRLDRKTSDKLRSANSGLVFLMPVIVFFVSLASLVLALALFGRLGSALHGCIDRGPGLSCSPAVVWNLGWPSAAVALASVGFLWKHDLLTKPKPTTAASRLGWPSGDELTVAAAEGTGSGARLKSASQAFVIELEGLPGLAGRVAREGLLGALALNTGSVGSYGLVVSDRETGREIGRLSSGSDYVTAVGFRDILRERADAMTASDFLTIYRLDPPSHSWCPPPQQVNRWSDVEKRRVQAMLVPVYAALLLAAVAVIWVMR